MPDPYRPGPGTPVEDLETPCLLLDLDALEANYRTVASLYAGNGPRMRQHAKNVKAPVLVQKQMWAGGTVGGVCVAKTAEAEVMVEGGIRDILVTSQVVGDEKLERLCSLARVAAISVAVDHTRHVESLSRVAARRNVSIGVVIEVNTSMGRAGVRGDAQAVAIARLARDLPGVEFRGVMSHQTLPGRPDRETRFLEGERFIRICLAMKEAIEAAGIPVDTVSSGETWTYDVVPHIPGVTEVEGGTYALMGANYTYMEDFRVAAKVLSTVISRPDERTAIGDAGLLALAGPGGALPSVEGLPEVSVVALGAATITLHSAAPMPLRLGEQFLLVSGQQDIMVNRWDQYIAVREGLVEAVWDIGARGCHH